MKLSNNTLGSDLHLCTDNSLSDSASAYLQTPKSLAHSYFLFKYIIFLKYVSMGVFVGLLAVNCAVYRVINTPENKMILQNDIPSYQIGKMSDP